MVRRSSLVVSVLSVVLIAALPSFAAYPFQDDAETGLARWSADPPWAVTSASVHAGSHAFTDSPGTNYANGASVALTVAAPIDLTAALRPRLAFWHRHALENGFDHGRVEVSIDGGATWQVTALATFTGGADWTREQIDLSAYKGQAALKIRFRLVSDTSVTQDGWTIDDVLVDEGPAPVTVNPPSAPSANGLTLSWSTSAQGDFASYRVVRGLSAGFDATEAITVATITDRNQVTLRDGGLAQKTTYWYRVVVVRGNGLETASNEVSATTLPGTDFPLLDAGEAGPGVWSADPPWALSVEAARAGHAWSDSPGGAYAPNLGGTSLTLAAPLNLAASSHPVLSFWHLADLPGNDHGLVEVSTNDGLTWTALRDFYNVSVPQWTHVQVDLSAYRTTAVLLRFRVTTDGWTEGDGWHIDDISFSEQPAVVAAPSLSSVAARSASVSWIASSDPDFSHYAVVRAQPTGTTINSTHAAQIADRATTVLIDSALLIGTTYSWRVYAVNHYGAYSADSPTESTATTKSLPLPFTEGFEGNLSNWNVTGAWSTTPLVAHGGTSALQDAPGNYPNSSDTSISTQIDLSAASWPVLSFWDRFEFQPDADGGRVEISTDGTSWSGVFFVSGARTTWRLRRIDLSPWKGNARVWVRFRVFTDGATAYDGWTIDDVSVAEHAAPARTLPFLEGFESGTDAWLSGNWEDTATTPRTGARVLEDFPWSMLPANGWFTNALSGTFDLSSASSPQLTFFVRGRTGYQQSFRAQVSTDGGLNWTDLWAAGFDYASWTRIQVSLASYRVAGVRLRFATTGGCCPDATSVLVDDVAIEDAPTAPVMQTPVPHLKSIDVSWSAPSVPAFARYEVYRKAGSGVDLSSTKIATIGSAVTTSVTDTGLSIGKTYSYKVYVVDTREVYTESNEVSATTTPLALPVNDPMENDANWVAEGTNGTWAVGTEGPHGGTGYFSDSPLGAYQNGMDTYLTTAVDLRTASWPVLTFWDRFGFEVNGDVGRVEVSVDSGASYTAVYAATGSRGTWLQRRIDLSPWKGRSPVIIRFRSVSDGGTVNDGWSVDDVTIAEHAAPLLPLPFSEGFESGATNWLSGNWEITSGSPHAGASRIEDFPNSSIPWSGWFVLPLGGRLDLSATTSPQWVFWLRGSTGYQQSIRAQVSTNGGVEWQDVWATGNTWSAWTRVQLSLSSWRTGDVRLRFATTSGCCWDADGIALDDITVEESPAAPTMQVPVPHLKSMDVSWSAPTIANFKQYEIYRKTSPGVDTSSTRVAVVTDPAVTTVTDTGLSIGRTYYYRVYLVTTSDVYTGSNEIAAATAALSLPISDTMETDANWVAEGTNGTWGIGTFTPHGGAGYFADSPGGAYLDNMETSLTTAVNLATAAWPVLAFWDRLDFEVNADWGRVEVSTNSGASWTGVYVASGTRTSWVQRHVDLSPFRGNASVMVRFRSLSNGGTVRDGWDVDDVSIAESAAPPAALPFTDGFEGDLSRWYSGSWEVTTEDAHGGSHVLHDFPRTMIPPSGWFSSYIARSFDLSATTDPQWVFFYRGTTGYQQSIRAQVSTDGGVNWIDLWAVGIGNANWRRAQFSLKDYRSTATRLRLVTTSGCCWDASGVLIDDVAVEDALPKPAVHVPDAVTMRSARIRWERIDRPTFGRYVVYRSTSANVTEDATIVASITDNATTSFTDTTLDPRARYYYRVFAYSTREVGTGSDEVSVVTLGSALPFGDGFETDTGAWVATGTWGREAAAGRAGSAGLTEGPGVYGNSLDTAARIGLDLTGTTWPVLTFHERHQFEASADWLRVEVSTNFGASWEGMAALSGPGPSWTERRIDLSPWKNQPYVWIRFRLMTDGGTVSDGVALDDVSIVEHVPFAASLPFFETFDGDLSRWQGGSWTRTTESPHRGTGAIDNARDFANPWSGWYRLTLGTELDLSQTTAPAWTFWVRGFTDYQQSIRAQISGDHGLTWTDVWATGIGQATWSKITVDLSSWKQAGLRFRFVYTGGCCTGSDSHFLDDVGIGDPAPAPPTPETPVDGAIVGVLRPTLTLRNAFDAQTDPLTYDVEVYADRDLTQRVAQVPAVAETDTTTSWTVDVDLSDNHPYWWRARAHDASLASAWSAAAMFRVIVDNDPPSIPEFVAPPNGARAWGADATLTWYPSIDPNPGDTISYDLTIDDAPDFATPEIDQTGLTASGGPGASAEPTLTVRLGDLAGFASLQDGHAYYWRLRAVDGRGRASAWTPEVRYFQYGADALSPTVSWGTPAEDATLTAAPIVLAGTASDVGSGLDYIQVSTDGGTTWKLASGAGSWSYSFTPDQNGKVTALARAADRAGNVSVALERRFTVALPDVSSRLVAVGDNSVIALAWDPPALAGVTGYKVYRATQAGGAFELLTAPPLAASSKSFHDTGLLPGVVRYYVVTALYDDREAGRSPEAFARTHEAPRPPFVDDVTLARQGNDLVLSWSPLTFDRGPGPEGVPGYWLYEGTTAQFTPSTAAASHYVGGAHGDVLPGAATGGASRFFMITSTDDLGREGFFTQWFVEEDDATATTAPDGAWTERLDGSASDGRAIVSTTQGASVTIAFHGTGISLGLLRGPAAGIASISVDGAPAGTVDLFAPEPEWGALPFHSRGLLDGPHTLTITVTGQKNASSAGTEVVFDRYLGGREPGAGALSKRAAPGREEPRPVRGVKPGTGTGTGTKRPGGKATRR